MDLTGAQPWGLRRPQRSPHWLKEPLNKSRSPSAPLFAGGDGVAAMGRRPAEQVFHSPCAAGRPSGGPKGRAGCVAAHCVGPATRLRRALPSRPLGSSGLPGLVQRFLKEPLNKSRKPSAPLFAAGDGGAAMGRQPAAQRECRSPPAAGRPSRGPKGCACGVAADCVAPAARLRCALPSRPLGCSGLPGLVQRFLKA